MTITQQQWDSLNETFGFPHSPVPLGPCWFTEEEYTAVSGCGGGHFGWVPSAETRRRISESTKGHKAYNKGVRGVVKLGHTNEKHIKVPKEHRQLIVDRVDSGERYDSISKDYPNVSKAYLANIVFKTRHNSWK